MTCESILEIVKEYGMFGILAILLYVIVNGRFIFIYPIRKK